MNESHHISPQKSSATARIEQWIALLVLVVLVGGCYLVLQPFLTAVILAIILCCTTWPVFVWLQRVVRGGVTVASLLVTLAVALVVLLDGGVAGATRTGCPCVLP